jgi:hypothetical protein
MPSRSEGGGDTFAPLRWKADEVRALAAGQQVEKPSGWFQRHNPRPFARSPVPVLRDHLQHGGVNLRRFPDPAIDGIVGPRVPMLAEAVAQLRQRLADVPDFPVAAM